MAMSVKQLNGDASFLLTFEPITTGDSPRSSFAQPFRILLDPWLNGSCYDYHPTLSKMSHRQPALIPSLAELPVPDLVIISQDKNDHCNEATLRRLPATGTKTVILAEPAAAKKIQGWKHFDHDKVHALPRWEDPRQTGHDTILRIEIPALAMGGDAGEVTVAMIPQRRDFRSHNHPAIGITYRPPTSQPSRFSRMGASPPASPKTTTTPQLYPHRSSIPDFSSYTIRPILSLPPTPPASPPLRSKRSAASLTPALRNRAVSVIFAPHGVAYGSLESYATSHLVSEAALPLTAFLHCFDDVDGPWWFRPRSCGMPVGMQTAVTLGARAWVSTHDGEKVVKGLVGRGRRTRRHGVEDVRWSVERAAGRTPGAKKGAGKATEVLALGIGEEVAMTSEGVWNAEPPSLTPDSGRPPTLMPTLSKYGMGDVLANISSEPFVQAVPRSPTSIGSSKLHTEISCN